MKKNRVEEIMVRFPSNQDSNQLDYLINEFEKNLESHHDQYYLKESEDPYIFFLEHPKADKFIKKVTLLEQFRDIEMVHVNCVKNNINHVTTLIIEKIRHKVSYKDSFKIQCYLEGFSVNDQRENMEKQISDIIEEVIQIPYNNEDPVWSISIYILSDMCAINIHRSNKNRNKFSQYT